MHHSVSDIAHAIAVVVHPGQQHGAGRRTGGRYMKVGKAAALCGQGIEMRRSDFPAKRTNIAKAPIIGKENDDIGTLRLRRLRAKR